MLFFDRKFLHLIKLQLYHEVHSHISYEVFAQCVPLNIRIIRYVKKIKNEIFSFNVGWSEGIIHDLNENPNEI